MASTTDHTIFLSGAQPFNIEGRVQEDLGAGTIIPGYLLEYNTGEALVPHATGTGFHRRMIALENPFDDDNTVQAINSPYLTDDTVRFIYAQPGDLMYMYLAAAGGTAVKGRSLLCSHGDGTLRVSATGSADLSVVGVPEEDLDNNTGAAARIRVRIL